MRTRSFSSLALLLSLLLTLSMLGIGCGEEGQDLTSPAPTDQGYSLFGPGSSRIQSAMQIQVRETPRLMRIAQVVGTATGATADGTPVIKVYTEVQLPDGLLPRSIDGLEVVQEVTGRIVAMKGKPGGGGGGGGGVSHTALQTPPIQLGTSGGWRHDLANGFCCGGTLGALVNKGGKLYVLSNYHVLEADKVSGGNGLVASTGDPVIQPGLIDVGCDANAAQNVANLLVVNSLPNNNVDCAIAEIIDGMVRTDGSILEVGTLSAQTTAAFIGQKVKKSGRTTGLTRSSVDGLNATISVAYEDECAGNSAFTKTFTGQIVIKNRGSKFLAGGDSGSLMVEDVSTNPRAVGLLYAGSSSTAIANPIDDVLTFLNATMVGN